MVSSLRSPEVDCVHFGDEETEDQMFTKTVKNHSTEEAEVETGTRAGLNLESGVTHC